MSSVSTALIGNYCSRNRLGRPLPMSNQKKRRIEKSISDTENFEKSPTFGSSTRSFSTYRSTTEREKRTNVSFP
jgi:hypothetical protein